LLHRATSDDSNYDLNSTSQIYIHVIDNDQVAVILSESAIVLQEGVGVATIGINLSSAPSSTVRVVCETGPHIAMTPNTFIFSAGGLDWNIPQQMHVSALDDNMDAAISDGVTCSATSMSTHGHRDEFYDGVRVSLAVDIVNDDFAGVSFMWNEGVFTGSIGVFEVEEGATFLNVSLDLAKRAPDLVPGAEIMIGGDVGYFVTKMEPGYLEFSPAYFGVLEYGGSFGSFVDIEYNGSFGSYGSSFKSILYKARGQLSARESGYGGSFFVSLRSQPMADVVVEVHNDNAQMRVFPFSLTFSAVNWNEAQGVDVVALEDDMDEGVVFTSIVHAVYSDDAKYNAGVRAVNEVQEIVFSAFVESEVQNIALLSNGTKEVQKIYSSIEIVGEVQSIQTNVDGIDEVQVISTSTNVLHEIQKLTLGSTPEYEIQKIKTSADPIVEVQQITSSGSDAIETQQIITASSLDHEMQSVIVEVDPVAEVQCIDVRSEELMEQQQVTVSSSEQNEKQAIQINIPDGLYGYEVQMLTTSAVDSNIIGGSFSLPSNPKYRLRFDSM